MKHVLRAQLQGKAPGPWLRREQSHADVAASEH